ncbi:MAG: hypothetical protein IANPNBLG_04246 [Bryobacteraceae bacterium]|nr:hypothetical protein [Bryobacteraceae bacterium]
MAKTGFASVDDYIASQPEDARAPLERVRGAIRRALPKAVEKISYNIPAYRLRDKNVLYFAGWRRHYSLYPAGARLIAAFQEELAAYEVEKNTIRFPFSAPVPVKLIARIAKFRAREAAGRE